MNKTNFIIRNIDKGIWQRFRSLCLKKGKSANQYVKELIKREVSRKPK